MKSKIVFTLSLLAVCSLGLAPISGIAAEKDKKGAAAVATEPTRPIPYNGKVIKVDANKKSFTLSGKSGRVMHVTDTTEFKKDGAAASFASVAVGEEVRGQATKNGDEWTVVSVTVGAKEKAPEKKAEKKAPEPAKGPGNAPAPTSGAGSPNSSSAGPAVGGVAQPGGQAPAGAKKN